MSSLVLQLFVNLNKILNQYPGSSPGPNYAKQLVDRIKQDQPQLLSSSDPTNAHTHALTAYALGIGLKELRSHDVAQAEALAPALQYALEIADEQLEQLGSDEVHLVLMAHEYYKSHLNGKGGQSDPPKSSWGRARSATDQLPMATILEAHASSDTIEHDDIGWRPARSDVEARDPEPVAPVIVSAPLKEKIQAHEPVVVNSLPLSTPLEAATQSPQEHPTPFHTKPTTPRVVPLPTPHAIQASENPPVLAPFPVEAPKVQTPTPSVGTFQPVHKDMGAEREFTEAPTDRIVEEGITAWGNRQRNMALREDIPQAAFQGPDMGQGRGERLGQYAHDLPSESGDSLMTGASETYMHTESAPDRVARRDVPQGRGRTLVAWALAPLGLALPPVAFFQAGVLWNQGKRGHSVLLMGLGSVGTAVFLLIGLGKI